MFRILFADDQAYMRSKVAELLANEPDVHELELANGGAQAIELSRQSHLDAVVLDISMPGVNGITALATLQQEQPRLPVVMLSAHADAFTVRRCLQLGAAGHVAKEVAAEELMLAIRAVITGKTYLCKVSRALLAANS
jgi:DNA-binding NarL/FixJ family response regulator